MPAVVQIGVHCIIQPNCSLYSCIIEDECFIGANSVIMEGCRIEKGAIIAPNSVVPPGRVIPARQIWGGNPVQFIRDAKDSECFANYALTYELNGLGELYMAQYTPWNYSYLQKESTKEDVDLNPEDLISTYYTDNPSSPRYYYDN
jgi:carbonic anhydrase/acetyltransferase-like protein (isoleucine patch superfamily)